MNDAHDRFRFSCLTSDIDRDRVHQWLSEESYWAKGRARSVQEAAIDGSRNYGLFDTVDREQVAYARIVTDGTTFAWLCDVFVAQDRRGQGLGKLLIAGVVSDLTPLGISRILLATRDAHGLYAQNGFTALPDPSIWMVRAAAVPGPAA